MNELYYMNYIVYLDDILTFSASLIEHIAALKQIFLVLREEGRADKCKFLQRETEFLGHVVTKEGLLNPE